MVQKKGIKVYVSVKVDFREDGVMLPREITWENGKSYTIDKVTDIRQAAAMRAGGQGDRYTVKINGKQSYLFFERSANQTGNNIGRWFVERKNPAPHSVGIACMADHRCAHIYSDGTLRMDGKIIDMLDPKIWKNLDEARNPANSN